jgi:hypothetical protein
MSIALAGILARKAVECRHHSGKPDRPMSHANFSRAALLAGALALMPAATAGLAAVDARSGPQFSKLIADQGQLCRAGR